MNAPRKLWTENETKMALFLYFQLPFGQLHYLNPEVQKLASILGRTNSSVAMKLCNFASLDPKITESGRKGLQGASAQDRRVWAAFNADWTAQIGEAEQVWISTEVDTSAEGNKLRDNVAPFAFGRFDGPSTANANIERRVGQSFFRRSVLANFDNMCCITGIAEPALLNASHIVPWGIDVKNRHNPANGLCLSATFDRAFDRGLLTLDESRAVLISRSLLTNSNQKTRDFFEPYHGVAIIPSIRFDPDPASLKWHNLNCFRD